MTFPFHDDRKRHRGAASSNEDAFDSDSNHHAPDHRSTQAERKRELERNRRHVINVRFAELDAQLQRTTPRPDGKSFVEPPPSVDACKLAPVTGRRIDKEAVLKEAIQRLALKENEVNAAAIRVDAMSTEIHNLRAEKVELREDKTYLRGELETMRAEVKRLRADNLHLMHVISKISTVKIGATSLSANPASESVPNGKSLQDPAIKPVPGVPASHVVTVPVSPSLVRALVPTSSPVVNQTSLPTRQQTVAPVPATNDSPQSLSPAVIADHQSSNAPVKPADMTIIPSNEPLLPHDVFSFQSADEIADLFANFTPANPYFDDPANYNPITNDFHARSVPLSQSQPSPEMTRAATIAATTIAARSHGPNQQSAPTADMPNALSDAAPAPMVISMPPETCPNPAAFQPPAVNAQSLHHSHIPVSHTMLAPSPPAGEVNAVREANPLTNDTNHPRSPAAKNKRDRRVSDVACCVWLPHIWFGVRSTYILRHSYTIWDV